MLITAFIRQHSLHVAVKLTFSPDVCSSALKVKKPMKDTETPETHSATFECEVSHFHAPGTWMRNGTEIEMSEKYKIVVQGKHHELKIMHASKDDSGEYSFICGSDRVSATLTVKRESSC